MKPFSKVRSTKTKRIQHALLFAFVLLSVASCKKEPEKIPYCEEYPNECVDVREVKDYFYFKIGSYWVYEEETSGERDSVYVIETSNDTGSVLFSTTKYSTYDGYDYNYQSKGVWSFAVDDNHKAKKTDKSTRVISAKFKSGDYVGEATCFLFYPTEGLSSPANGGVTFGYDNTITIQNIFKEYNVSDEVFQNVVVVNEEHTLIEESQPTVHYYSPKVGLIKKELLLDNEVWNLIDYHIEK